VLVEIEVKGKRIEKKRRGVIDREERRQRRQKAHQLCREAERKNKWNEGHVAERERERESDDAGSEVAGVCLCACVSAGCCLRAVRVP
jgi:hypothetical protein